MELTTRAFPFRVSRGAGSLLFFPAKRYQVSVFFSLARRFRAGVQLSREIPRGIIRGCCPRRPQLRLQVEFFVFAAAFLASGRIPRARSNATVNYSTLGIAVIKSRTEESAIMKFILHFQPNNNALSFARVRGMLDSIDPARFQSPAIRAPPARARALTF